MSFLFDPYLSTILAFFFLTSCHFLRIYYVNNPFSVYWYFVNVIILVDESPVLFYLVTPILIEELDGLGLVDLFTGDSFILRLTWGNI